MDKQSANNKNTIIKKPNDLVDDIHDNLGEFEEKNKLSIAKIVHYSIDEMKMSRYKGPADESNWVIPGSFLMGSYPASLDDTLHIDIIQKIVSCGIRTFVCLQEEYNHFATEQIWKCGISIRPYIHDALNIIKKNTSQNVLELLHLPIHDLSITSDILTLQLAEELCYRLCHDEVIYIHCW